MTALVPPDSSRQFDGTLILNRLPSVNVRKLDDAASTLPVGVPVTVPRVPVGRGPLPFRALRVASSVDSAGESCFKCACTFWNVRVSRTGLSTRSACASRVMYSTRLPGFG